MVENPILQGLELMIAGMGTVFVFLTLLVFATSTMSALVRRMTPEPVSEATGAEAVSDEEVAAITTAIALHRKSRGR